MAKATPTFSDQISFNFEEETRRLRLLNERSPSGGSKLDNQKLPLLDPTPEPPVKPDIVGLAAAPLNSSTRYGMWASNMTVACGIGLVGSATVIFYWLYLGAVLMTMRDIILSIYGLIVGAAITVYEARWTKRAPTNFPWRAVIYTLLAIPALFSIITLTAAAHLILAAGAHLVSAAKSESFVQERKVKPRETRTLDDTAKGWVESFKFSINEPNIFGEIVTMSVWVAVNLILFFDVLFVWFDQINAMPSNYSASQFVAWAKAWGATLDFNCALILLPVCRTFIRYLYDYSTQSQTRSQRFLRSILAFIPLDKALEFHKVVAWFVLLGGVMHTIMHLVNYGLSPDYTWQFYGIWPWTTGVALFICMMFMYGAVPHNVKWAHFEIFWYTHHFFIGFFILLIPHGRGGFNRNVWKGLIITVPIYLLERLYRSYSAYRTVALTSITNMGNVIAIGFDRKSAFPSGYKEGQYLYLNAPTVSKGEWHPFTISSAPQENDVTLHIRVLDAENGTSWTAKVADFCSLLMPSKTAFVSFTNTNSKSGTRGKIFGPDGQKLFRIYGPHSAPTQHVSEYSIAMVAGAGIGITPVCATMKSIAHYRWKFSIGRSYPDHCYFYFVTSHKEINSFRWVIRMLKEADDEVHNLWAVNKNFVDQKTFQFHIFVTSVPDNCTPFEPINIEDDVKFWGSKLHADENLVLVNAAWTEMELLNVLQCPSRTTQRLGNIYVHRGRPDWSAQFESIANTHPANDIGVAYCGNPVIASDLKQQCVRWSSTTTKTFFRLHKENF